MIECLPDVSHLRYRGGRVEWRKGRFHDAWCLFPVGNNNVDHLGGVWLEYDEYLGDAYPDATSDDDIFRGAYGTGAEAASAIISFLVRRGIVAEVGDCDSGVTDDADDSRVFVLSPELLALASAVAQRRGQSLDDLLTRIVTAKVVSIAVVDYRDDPEIRRLHINLAESWGRE